MAICTTPAIVLRTTSFGDTSQIAQVLTRDYGRVGLMARGVRKRPGALAPFQSGSLTFYNKPGRDLQTFREFAVAEPRMGVARAMERFTGAAVMVELVLRTSGEDALGQSFQALESALNSMDRAADHEVWARILGGAWRMVRTLGFAPDLSACGGCGRELDGSEMLRFSMKEGAVVCDGCSQSGLPRLGPGARRQLLGFLHDIEEEAVDLEPAHRRPHLLLLGDFVTYHVTGDPPLRSLKGLMELLEK